MILAWTGNELSRGQTWWRTDGLTDGQAQATTIPEGQNWPRVKTITLCSFRGSAATRWYNLKVHQVCSNVSKSPYPRSSYFQWRAPVGVYRSLVKSPVDVILDTDCKGVIWGYLYRLCLLYCEPIGVQRIDVHLPRYLSMYGYVSFNRTVEIGYVHIHLTTGLIYSFTSPISVYIWNHLNNYLTCPEACNRTKTQSLLCTRV